MQTYTFQSIAPLPGTDLAASSINDLGQIAGSYSIGGVSYAFFYNAGTYTTLNYPGSYYTNAFGLNNAGDIVGAYADSTTDHYLHGFLYSQGSYISLESPYATYPQTIASGVNDLQQIVGQYSISPNYPFVSGFLYGNGQYNSFSTGAGTILTDINNSGEFIGYYGSIISGLSYSFVATADGGINYLSFVDALSGRGLNNVATGINNSGQIVGSYNEFLDAYHIGSPHGFIYSDDSYISFDHPLGTQGTVLDDINSIGQILGHYYDANGRHTFLATPTSVPANHAPLAANIAARLVARASTPGMPAI